MPELVDTFPIAKRPDVPRSFEEPRHFASDHLYLAAFLVCLGHRIINSSRKGARVFFEFAKTTDLLTDVARFMSGAPIPARQYSFQLLKLKRQLYGVE